MASSAGVKRQLEQYPFLGTADQVSSVQLHVIYGALTDILCSGYNSSVHVCLYLVIS